MGLLGLAKILAKSGGSLISKTITLSSVKQLPHEIMMSSFTKGEGLSKEFVEQMIKESKSPHDLKVIYEYLQSAKNDIPYSETKSLMRWCVNKARKLKLNQMEFDRIRELKENISDPFAFDYHHVLEWFC
jgi:hypothetical protein